MLSPGSSCRCSPPVQVLSAAGELRSVPQGRPALRVRLVRVRAALLPAPALPGLREQLDARQQREQPLHRPQDHQGTRGWVGSDALCRGTAVGDGDGDVDGALQWQLTAARSTWCLILEWFFVTTFVSKTKILSLPLLCTGLSGSFPKFQPLLHMTEGSRKTLGCFLCCHVHCGQ